MNASITQEEKIISHEYKDEKNQFKIEITTKNNDFYFTVINEENKYEIYETIINLSELIKKNDFFKLCKSSEEFINYINQLFENKNVNFEKNSDLQSLRMNWKFNALFKIETLSFDLTKKQISLGEQIGLLSNNLVDIKLQVNEIKKSDLSKIYKKIDFLENKIKEIELNFKSQIRKEVENFFTEKNKNNSDNFNNILDKKSLILTNEKEIKFVSEFIRMIKPNSKLKLIYRASIDGQMGKDFHSKCDNIFPTITFFKTENNKKFGGYTESNWNLSTYGSDPNAFIFSIDKEKYYKVNKCPEKSIYSDKKRGPNFDGLWVQEPFFTKNSFWETPGDNQCFPKNSDSEMSENNRAILEIEIYKVIS